MKSSVERLQQFIPGYSTLPIMHRPDGDRAHDYLDDVLDEGGGIRGRMDDGTDVDIDGNPIYEFSLYSGETLRLVNDGHVVRYMLAAPGKGTYLFITTEENDHEITDDECLLEVWDERPGHEPRNDIEDVCPAI